MFKLWRSNVEIGQAKDDQLLLVCIPQELTRELVAEKLPALYAHLTNNCVDIAVITFNWLLAAFVDALPTEVSCSWLLW